jgi:cathepsin L
LEARFHAHLRKHKQEPPSDPDEFRQRLTFFNLRAEKVERHNRQLNRRWTAGLNHLSDRTDSERKQLLGYKADHQNRRSSKVVPLIQEHRSRMVQQLPDEKMWTGYYNTELIRDQGRCGSCWAVTASTVLSAHSELWHRNKSFSTQEIIDCVPNPNKCGGTGGCDGATVELAMQYTMLKGLRDVTEYGDYTGSDGSCDQPITDTTSPSLQDLTSVMDVGAQIFQAQGSVISQEAGMFGWERLPANKYLPLLEALYNKGPVAVSMAANDIFDYSHGIFDSCTDFIVNHAVTLVGYGKQGTEKYYVIQNSWGPTWGESGRIRIQRTDSEDEHCGMDDQPQDGVACAGETEAVEACGTCGILLDSVVPYFSEKPR